MEILELEKYLSLKYKSQSLELILFKYDCGCKVKIQSRVVCKNIKKKRVVCQSCNGKAVWRDHLALARGVPKPIRTGQQKKGEATFALVKEKLEIAGFIIKPLTEGHKHHIFAICPKGHESNFYVYNFLKGHGCSHCSNRNSKQEIELYDMVKEKYPDAQSSVSVLRNRMFKPDIWVPSLRKIVEFDGDYWHNTPSGQDRDLRKDQECEELGIKILHIKYSDYIKDKEGQISKMWFFLGS
jgi:very-short-patch-repair endonuclease